MSPPARCKNPPRTVLIVFTDEKGSTERDEQLLHNGANKRVRARMAKSRAGLFSRQLQDLTGGNWTLLKNVGDSLLFKAKLPEDNPSTFLINRLEELYDIWVNIKSKLKRDIRITVHCAPETHYINGNELKIETTLGLPGGGEFSKALYLDLFGPGFNRAARLAAVPSGPLFIISNEAISLLLKELDDSNDSDKSYFSAQRLKVKSKRLPLIHGPIPLLHIKGIESVGMKNPWWIWELPFEYKTRRTLQRRPTILAPENKRLQMIRIINVALPRTFQLGERNHHALMKTLDDGFEEHIDLNPQLKFYIDLCIRVEDVISMYTMSDERKFDEQAPQPYKQSSYESRFLPFYVALTSSRDVATDNILREQGLKPEVVDSETASFQPLTYQVHNQMVISAKVDVVECTNRSRQLFLILFQIKDKHLNDVDEVDKFFHRVPPVCIIGTEKQTTLDLVLWGLIRGDKDGFILLSAAEPVQADELCDYLTSAGSGDAQGFFSKFVTLKVYIGKALWPMQEMNIEWLKNARGT